MIRRLIIVAIAATALVTASASTASAKTTLKFATLAPKASPWGKVFTKWCKIVEKKTDKEIDCKWLWNGSGGPENGVVGKIAAGQLAGGAITAIGMSTIDKSVLALQVPGVFDSWKDLDKARRKLRKKFKRNMKKEGFYPLGWGDVGKVRLFSKGFAVKSPGDLKGKSPAINRGDPVAPAIYETIGGITPVPGSVTEFLPMLQSGKVNVMNTPALAATQLQWASRLDHMSEDATAYAIGALVMSRKTLKSLPKDQRKIVKKYGKKASKRLTKTIRGEDEASFNRLRKGKMTTHKASEAEKAEWKKVFKDACGKLKSALPGSILSDIGAC